MRRLLVFVLVLVALALPAAPAAAGGGCHSAALSDGSTREIDLAANCFTPTVNRVEPGTTVVFRNADEYVHRLDAPGLWGPKDDFEPGDEVAFRFDNAGVFPFSCYIHPLMTGAVVVGDGVLADSDLLGITRVTTDDVAAAPVRRTTGGGSASSGGSTSTDDGAASDSVTSTGSVVAISGVTAAAAAILLAVVLLARRRRAAA